MVKKYYGFSETLLLLIYANTHVLGSKIFFFLDVGLTRSNIAVLHGDLLSTSVSYFLCNSTHIFTAMTTHALSECLD